MKPPPGFDSAIKFYRYIDDHIDIDLSNAPDNLILKYDFFGIEIQKHEFTLGELRAACWKEIADAEIKPEDVFMIECALNDRYPSYPPTKITELLHKLEKI